MRLGQSPAQLRLRRVRGEIDHRPGWSGDRDAPAEPDVTRVETVHSVNAQPEPTIGGVAANDGCFDLVREAKRQAHKARGRTVAEQRARADIQERSRVARERLVCSVADRVHAGVNPVERPLRDPMLDRPTPSPAASSCARWTTPCCAAATYASA